MNELISVIIPVYNAELYLSECLDGVKAQSYKNIEIILIDDGSTDKSGTICDEAALSDKRVRVIHRQNGGVSRARNAGIKASKGEYLTFIDADDTVKADMLSHLYELIDAMPETIAVTGLSFSDDGTHHKSVPLSCGNGFADKFDALLMQWNDEQPLLGPCAKLYPSDIIKENEILFDETIFMGEDRLFVAEVLLKSKGMFFSDSVFYTYRWNEESMCRSSYNEKYLTIFDAFDKIRALTDGINNEIKQAAVKTCAAHCAFYTASSANSGDKDAVYSLKRISKRYIKEFLSLSDINIKEKLRAWLLCVCPQFTVKIYRALKGTDLK